MILSESSKRLGELTQKTQEAADKGKYVKTLSEKIQRRQKPTMQSLRKHGKILKSSLALNCCHI